MAGVGLGACDALSAGVGAVGADGVSGVSVVGDAVCVGVRKGAAGA